MIIFSRILKEPLLHFLLIGMGLFVIYGYFDDGSPQEETDLITVDRAQLLTFMQYRAKTFEPDRFNAMLDRLSEPQRQGLIDDYVREEALYREARALGLDKSDYVTRRRLVQQLEFITRSFIAEDTGLTQEELQAYFEANKAKYYVPSKITFAHVFFSNDKGGADKAETGARGKLRELNKNQVPFHVAMSHGDRFLYHTNYVEKEQDEIASHFGLALQEQIFALEENDKVWHGPFPSPYGFHLVMVTKQIAGYDPSLDEVRGQAFQDAQQANLQVNVDKAIQSIVDGYRTNIKLAWTESP